jgi:hypothetical protein
MTATERPLSELPRHAARRIRNDGRFELQTAVAGAPFRAVDVGPIADLLAAAIANLALYEGRGWDEAKILDRVSEMDRAAVALVDDHAVPEEVPVPALRARRLRLPQRAAARTLPGRPQVHAAAARDVPRRSHDHPRLGGRVR